MDRLEEIREIVDHIIEKIQDTRTRKFAFIHTYGVTQNCALLALRRNVNVQIACVAGMLHDIAIYANNCSHASHAKESASLAKTILEDTNMFDADEILIITNAIALHSNKLEKDGGKLSELLKDADVLQHYLYNTDMEPSAKDRYRLFYILEELDMKETR